MSSDQSIFNILGSIDAQTLLASRTGGGKAAGGDPSLRAFEVQMRMMNQLLAEPGPEDAGTSMLGALGGGGDLAGEALMYDALATISRLFAQRGSDVVPGRAALARANAAHARHQGAEEGTNSVRVKVGGSAGEHDTGRMQADNTVYEVVDGKLSAVFESGKQGAVCIGYDRVGGTSYGTYQIASRTGSMDRFLRFLRHEAPELASRLKRSGPANTGSRAGGMPEEWRRIAAEQPERFEKLQREFIKKDHYQPARNKILAATGLDIDQAPHAVQEVLWSTAVQHGPTGAARIFTRAIDAVEAVGSTESMGVEDSDFAGLVSKVYDSRKGQFGSSSSRVRSSVRDRLSREEDMALTMLSRGLDQLV
jgi:hypothetical protein